MIPVYTVDVVIDGLALIHGLVYYGTVTACNTNSLCSSATSTGVRVDLTPPIPGRVLNGYPGSSNLQFQASR